MPLARFIRSAQWGNCMLRLVGALLLAACPAIIGILLSSGLSRRRTELLQAIELIERLKTEISYSAREVNEIVRGLGEEDCFEKLSFLRECSAQLSKMPFPQAWRTAVHSAPTAMIGDDLEQLASISRILGASDAEGQLSALEVVEQNLKRNLEQAQQLCTTRGKLYRSMGALSGAALAILIL